MPALICGSLAFDTIAHFHGRFAQQILPDQIHILNVSFLVPTMRRDFGGCAGNIAYNLKGLGGEPRIMAALGRDGDGYLDRLKALDIDTRHILQVDEAYTAQCHITTDSDNNQITAFHPGAMSDAARIDVPREAGDLAVGIVAPDGRDAMVRHAAQMNAAGIPFIFDPGQGLPMFDGEDLRRFVDQATWVALNDYEARLLCERMDTTLEALSRSHLQGVIVTLGAEGCDLWVQGEVQRIPGLKADSIEDPTGCGDAFRAGLLYGLERDWPLARCVTLGNRLGALKIASQGPQNHTINAQALLSGL